MGQDAELPRISDAADQDLRVDVFSSQLFPISREVAVGRVRLMTVLRFCTPKRRVADSDGWGLVNRLAELKFRAR